MYRAKELQRACPRSQAWLRQALANGLIGAESQASTSTTTLKTSTRRFTAAARQRQSTVQTQRQSSKQLRPFSTSRTVCQDDKDAKAEAGNDKADIEVFVRDARAIFGNTLPKDYLNEEEYKLYLRLYGAPLRETQPEDVAILQSAERLRQAQEAGAKDGLGDIPTLSEDDYRVNVNERGQQYINVNASARIYEQSIEEVDPALADGEEYNPKNYEAEEYEAEDYERLTDDNATTTAPPIDENTNYMQARARSERQYNMLTRLQQDFETARLKAEDEAKLQKHKELQEEADLAAAAAKAIEDEEGFIETYDQPHEEEEWGAEDDEFRDDPQDAAFFGNSVSRVHPLTRLGHSRTNPSTVQLPKANFVEPITEMLKRTKINHVRMAAGEAFGGMDFPHSPRTVASPSKTKRGAGTYQQMPVAMEAGQTSMRDIEADVYISTVLPYVYTTAMSTLTEVRRRLGPSWVENMIFKADGSNPRVLDVGGGGGALAAWNSVFRAELSMLRDRGRLPKRKEPAISDIVQAEDEAMDAEELEALGMIVKARPTKDEQSQRRRLERIVVVGNDQLRYRVSRMLHDTTFIPRLPDLLHSSENTKRHIDAPATPHPKGRGRPKTYDVIIASHLLLPTDKPHERHAIVNNLWASLNPDGGVLIILEKGHPRGFEAVADARQLILDKHLEPPSQGSQHEPSDGANPFFDGRKDREPGMIIAPCTSHGKCPMYLTPGLSHGRKDFCHFSQRFTRPPFLQRLLLGTHHNHENVDFSYIAVQRGTQKADLPAEQKDKVPNTPELDDRIRTDLAKVYGISSDIPLPPQAPLVQGRQAADAAFEGFANVWTAPEIPDADVANPAFRQPPLPPPPPPKDAVNPHPLALARTVMPALKRQGHVTLDVCTPAGQLERWTVPRSFGKQAYHDARKVRWGDLWALGAKTRVPKTVRLGRHLVEKKKREEEEALLNMEGLEYGDEEPAVAKRTRNRQRAKWEKKTRGGKFGSKNKTPKLRGSREEQAEAFMKKLKDVVYDDKHDHV
ncbi:37S ribosomal protein S22 [Sporothrix stenoceras]|uniref:37S ribosomal protein S22 n=1 Tax=Sporothrix stenoceras TaxID=5173 RepID=A0ABR3Z2Q1_9PEZI